MSDFGHLLIDKTRCKAVNKFVRKRLELLKENGVNSICVFDGNRLPSKKDTNDKRRGTREEAKRKGIKALEDGQTGKAYQFFCQAIHITPTINESVRKLCKAMGFQVIVAPYEADAQLAYLSRSKIVDAVMTEDSDLFIFGTDKLIIKLDDSGNCKQVDGGKVTTVDGVKAFSDPIKWLRYACIMQGTVLIIFKYFFY